jgi:hypothetical protein
MYLIAFANGMHFYLSVRVFPPLWTKLLADYNSLIVILKQQCGEWRSICRWADIFGSDTRSHAPFKLKESPMSESWWAQHRLGTPKNDVHGIVMHQMAIVPGLATHHHPRDVIMSRSSWGPCGDHPPSERHWSDVSVVMATFRIVNVLEYKLGINIGNLDLV